MVQENREIKSSVFADLFGDDELDGKKNFLSLYNAIHGTNLKLEETAIEHKKIPQAICKPYDNDISMLYNGKKKTPQDYVMKLSDAFAESQKDPLCELKVRFMNIIGQEGKNLPVVQKCDMLMQYCEFMDIVFRHQAELNESPTTDEKKTCYEKALREAISKGILVDYLTRKGTAVINMFTDEYDYDLDMQVKAEEAFEKATQQKAVEDARSFYANGASIDLIAKSLHMTEDQVREIVNGPVPELQKQ